jgi:hypothetical protein
MFIIIQTSIFTAPVHGPLIIAVKLEAKWKLAHRLDALHSQKIYLTLLHIFQRDTTVHISALSGACFILTYKFVCPCYYNCIEN